MNYCSILVLLLLLARGIAFSQELDLILPTANDGIFTGKPEEFYMYVNRWVGGVQTTPWEGGQYGYVRDARQTPTGPVYTRFHAGIDIRPLERDAQGNPLDSVHAIATGRVVHTSPDAHGSNYGRYLVIEHQWDSCLYYSLYAHLSEICVTPGTDVAQGDKIAVMGYTGRGIDRERAHLHLEITLLLNENYDQYSDAEWGGAGNRHGNYNGINLQGIDVARLYTESRKNPALTIPQFLSKEEVGFYVDLPGSCSVDFIKRYPWMATEPAGIGSATPLGWRVAFNEAGVPLRVTRLSEPVPELNVTLGKPEGDPLSRLGYGFVSTKGGVASLTSRGKQLVSLLTFHPAPPPADGGVVAQMPPISERTHTVKTGESLKAIANIYHVEIAKLRSVNGITGSGMLKVGQILSIPDSRNAGAGRSIKTRRGR